ncbi:hypothetical protein JB92DRAFT_1601161 [Gautieria morchelliformis]|nr:hypothetical protein JB92DRAFT_1601161 [Gautieria morchelliformis]
MDRFYAPTSPEAQSFHRISTDYFWDSEHASLTETLMGLYASYAALSRYDSGQDLYIPPRNQGELFSTLRSYSFDAIHNLIAQSRSAMQPGGYRRACEIASKSILSVLAVKDHTAHLLELHQRPRPEDASLQCPVASPPRPLRA